MANFNGNIFNRTCHNAERGEESRVAVARDDLRADRFGLQPQLRADMLFDRWINIGEGANRARNGARCNLISGRAHPREVAIHFRIKTCEG